MKRRSSKTKELADKFRYRRREFVLGGTCAGCGGRPVDCHEILAGSHRHNAYGERACWLRLCRPCHESLQGTSYVSQLALKLLNDPSGFDLLKFHEAWGRPETAITPAEVLEAVRDELMEMG